jgi:hypothetical protein
VNNLDHAPITLLVRRSEAESTEDLFAQMQEHYDARVGDSDWGPKYRIGPTFRYRGQKFTQVQTFAGSLVMQVVFDTRKGKFTRPVIFRFSTEDSLRLLSPDGSEVPLDDSDLSKSEE